MTRIAGQFRARNYASTISLRFLLHSRIMVTARECISSDSKFPAEKSARNPVELSIIPTLPRVTNQTILLPPEAQGKVLTRTLSLVNSFENMGWSARRGGSEWRAEGAGEGVIFHEKCREFYDARCHRGSPAVR